MKVMFSSFSFPEVNVHIQLTNALISLLEKNKKVPGTHLRLTFELTLIFPPSAQLVT